MTNFFNTIWLWVKGNMIISIVILFAIVIIFFPKLLSGLTGKKRIHHRPSYYAKIRTRSGRSLPRSVGTRKRKQYTKAGTAKKPWQIKGSMAAKRHMAKIRKMR